MTPEQRARAQALLESALSERGLLTARAIVDLETVLSALEGREGDRASELYFFAVFGTPGPLDVWGWKVEGHHLSLNFTIADGTMVASSPLFLGADPAEVREGSQVGLRVLGRQEDAGRALVMALDSEQRSRAIVSADAPGDILTANQSVAEPMAPEGLPFSELGEIQQGLLLNVVDEYIALMAPDVAADRVAEIKKAGLNQIVFAWAGSTVRGARHYYRVQGPTFLIEFDNTQRDGNHVHAVWRDFDGDFGRDFLREHLAAAH